MRQKPAAFPVGLYGMLLFALCWLTLPAVFAPLERWLVGAVCVVPRALAAWSGEPVAAAESTERERRRALAADLHARMQRHDVAGARALLPIVYEPVFCIVHAAANDAARRGGGGQPGELRLDHSYTELLGCVDLVTKGDALLGFLQQAGVGIAVDDSPSDPARVLLLNHRSSRRVSAVVDLPAGGRLRFVTGPAAVIDPAPLRAELWDDPYRAASLDRSGQAVRTLQAPGDTIDLPAGLLLGHTRIWGYERAEGEGPLSIGVFVVPPIEPRALSHVVLWRDTRKTPAPGDVLVATGRAGFERRLPATVRDLPGAVYGRHLLAAAGWVPDGAAVVQDGLFLGTARGLAFGGGLVTSFAASRHRWSLVLLPDEVTARPRELEGEVLWGTRTTAWLRWRGDPQAGVRERLPAGQLFTGSNGPDCPAGLWIGSVAPHPDDRDVLVVTVPAVPGPRAAEVLVNGVAR